MSIKIKNPLGDRGDRKTKEAEMKEKSRSVVDQIMKEQTQPEDVKVDDPVVFMKSFF